MKVVRKSYHLGILSPFLCPFLHSEMPMGTSVVPLPHSKNALEVSVHLSAHLLSRTTPASSTHNDLHSLKNWPSAPTVPIEWEGFCFKAW